MVRGPGRRGSTRKARGRAKAVTYNDAACRVNGRLSHRSPKHTQKTLPEYYTEVETISKDCLTQTENAAAPLRCSPRKQPPTSGVLTPCDKTNPGTETQSLSVKLAQAERLSITPHKIQLCEESFQLKGRHVCIGEPPPTSKPTTLEETRLTLGEQRSNQHVAVKKVNNPSSKVNGASEGQNHKLTEFYPVRRSVRKTKRTVQEEEMRELQECVISEREDGLKVVNMEGKGRGVVTTATFRRGQFVVEYAGELIDLTQARQREERYSQDQNTGCYMYYFKHGNSQYCIDATSESGRLGRLVNHSRTGNLLTKIVFIKDAPRLVLVAKDELPVGVEVCYDYGDRSKESLMYHPWLCN